MVFSNLKKFIKTVFFNSRGKFKKSMGVLFLILIFLIWCAPSMIDWYKRLLYIEATNSHILVPPSKNGGLIKDIEATNAHIEVRDNDVYACITIHNKAKAKKGNIVKVDLYENQSGIDMSTINIWPVDCNIAQNDSIDLAFLIYTKLELKKLSHIINKYIVVRFSNGDVVYYGDSPKIEHDFRLEDMIESDNSFKFLGKAINREENFNDPTIEVTTENIYHLYREYDVEKVPSIDNIYRITPKKIYNTSFYFTRLIKFESGIQVAAATFYEWNIPYIFKQDDKYMVALNSLITTAGCNNSSFTAKTVLLDKDLNTLKEREFRFQEQKEPYYAYVYIDTLIQHQNDYEFKVINCGFDPEDYFEYKGRISKENIVTESSKKNRKI